MNESEFLIFERSDLIQYLDLGDCCILRDNNISVDCQNNGDWYTKHTIKGIPTNRRSDEEIRDKIRFLIAKMMDYPPNSSSGDYYYQKLITWIIESLREVVDAD